MRKMFTHVVEYLKPTYLDIDCTWISLFMSKSLLKWIFLFNGVNDFFRYPIYHIPMGRTIKDLSTCFLTYHTLSSSFQGIYSLFTTFDSHLFSHKFPFISTFLSLVQIPKKPEITPVTNVYVTCRYGDWRRREERRKEEEGKGTRHLTTHPIRSGHLQDARPRLGI